MTPARARGVACALLAAVGFNVLVFFALSALNRERPLPLLTCEAARFTLVEPPFVRPRPPEPERLLEPEPPPPETLADDPVEMEAPAAELTPLDLPLVAPDVTVPALRIAPVVAKQPRRLRPRRSPPAPPREPKRPPARPKTLGSEEVDEPPRDLAIRHPAYPASARRRGLEGRVTVRLLINEEGRVQQVEVIEVKGHAGFRQAVLRVVNLWRFTPPRHRGRRVKVWAVKTVRFNLEGPRG
ncbi:MAG: energy transducer TonB [Planctomycetota bacterium]|jgi:protein TonB